MKNPGIRIRSGKFKHSAISGLKAHRNHQNSTTARIKEAAFQIIRNRIDTDADWIFYDLCAGSGQMGIEALSLGATQAIFCELLPERLSGIQRSLTALDVPKENYTLVRARANKIIQEAFVMTEVPRVVWADPPYTYGNTASNDPGILIALYRAATLETPGNMPLLMIQVHEKNAVLTQEFLTANADLEVYRYGSNCLVVLQQP